MISSLSHQSLKKKLQIKDEEQVLVIIHIVYLMISLAGPYVHHPMGSSVIFVHIYANNVSLPAAKWNSHDLPEGGK